jgi:hypothetical protein
MEGLRLDESKEGRASERQEQRICVRAYVCACVSRARTYLSEIPIADPEHCTRYNEHSKGFGVCCKWESPGLHPVLMAFAFVWLGPWVCLPAAPFAFVLSEDPNVDSSECVQQ